MTNKTLSQELCSIAKIGSYIDRSDDNINVYKFNTKKELIRHLVNMYGMSATDEFIRNKVNNSYKTPDFENNNDNFVRLLEIFVKYDSGFIVFFSKKECLEEIIEYCDDGCNKLSKILQSENWSY